MCPTTTETRAPIVLLSQKVPLLEGTTWYFGKFLGSWVFLQHLFAFGNDQGLLLAGPGDRTQCHRPQFTYLPELRGQGW